MLIAGQPVLIWPQSMMQANLEKTAARVLHSSDGLAVAEINKVCVALWRSKPTQSRFAIQKKYLDATAAKYPGATAFICIVEALVEPPDEEIRKASSAMITALGTNLKGVGLVIEGGGFRAAITRSVLSGMMLFIRSPVPIKYFDSPSSAAIWVATHLPIGSVAAFTREIEEMRRELARG